MEFTPKHPSEEEVFALRFTRLLPAGVTITSAVWTSTVVQGTDAGAAAMISGSPSIAGDKVSQKIVAGVDGVQYEIACMATLSDGQKPRLCATLWVRAACVC